VRVFGLVQLQRAGERFEHALRYAGQVAALQARVVIDADAGEQGDLFPAQAGDPPVAAVDRQARPGRG
jgi:hypothetical protein